MDSAEFNWLAIIAATVFAAVVGALWYSPLLFLNRWMELRGVTMGAAQPGPSPAVAVAGSVVVTLS